MGFLANYVGNLAALCVGREPVRPLLFSYYVTHRCNLGCRYCCDGDGKRFKEDPVPELGTQDARQLLSILRQAGDTLDVTGGEPLVRDDLAEILGHAQAIGFRTVLNTKGIGLAHRPEVLRQTNVLVLSLDTLDPSWLAGIIGRDRKVAEEILATLDHALAACPQFGTKLVLAAVATPDNLGEVSQVLDFATNRGLGFHLSPEILGTRVNPALRGHPDYRQLINRALALKHSGRGVLGIPDYLLGIRDFRPFRCHPLLMPTIRPDGCLYYPCLESKQAQINLLEVGNYFRALQVAQERFGAVPTCRDCCHIFCHMALSLLQSQPLSALAELKHWRN